MIEAQQLSRQFGSFVAVREVSFEVRRGEAVGFLGPNGAGKSTTFRMLAGTLGPSSGHVRIFGHDMAQQPLRAKMQLGYMPENAPLYPEMTAGEYLRFRAELRGLIGKKKASACQRAAERAHCDAAEGTLIAHLSKGYRQRVALAEVLLGDPPALLLDEPTAGLDPNQVGDVRKLIRELAADHAVLVSTHVLSEVEATCSRAIVLRRGKVVAQGELSELGSTQRAAAFVVACGEQPRIDPEGLAGTLSCTLLSHERYRLESTVPADLTPLIDRVRAAGHTIEEAGSGRTPLEEVFESLTREAE